MMSSQWVAAAPFFIIPLPLNNSVLILTRLPLLVLVRGIQINEERKATEEISMSFQLKRIVFFFCILNFGLGGCLSNLAMAQIDPFRIWIPGVAKDVKSLQRVVSGYVTKGGVGVKNVEIYDGSKLLATTANDGFYHAYILLEVPYTLTPKFNDFGFSPPSIMIPANGDDYFKQNFEVMAYPGPVTLLSPSGTIYTSTPTYKWIASSLATGYHLAVDDSTGIKITKFYTDYQAGCNSGTCSVTPSTSLAEGGATWWVEACILDQCGNTSNHMGFIVSAGPEWVAGYTIPPTHSFMVTPFVMEKYKFVPAADKEVLGEGLSKSLAIKNACLKFEYVSPWSMCCCYYYGQHNGYKICIDDSDWNRCQ